MSHENSEMYRSIQKAVSLIPTDITLSDTQNPKKLNANQKLKAAIKLSQKSIVNIAEPIRTIHHLSCTGGTLLTKCIASMSNVLVINEVDPLSPLSTRKDEVKFTPTDLISLVRQGDLHADHDATISVFTESLKALNLQQNEMGRVIVLRDHSHSHFLTGPTVAKRPSVLEIVNIISNTLSVVSVRNPVDSFRSMQMRNWHSHFSPSTFDEYCVRYHAFLDHYSNLPIVKYEDFVSDPKKVMLKICDHLNLRYFDDFESVYSHFLFSGDSGRSGEKITSRPPRDIPDDFQKIIQSSQHYIDLAQRLGYTPAK